MTLKIAQTKTNRKYTTILNKNLDSEQKDQLEAPIHMFDSHENADRLVNMKNM